MLGLAETALHLPAATMEVDLAFVQNRTSLYNLQLNSVANLSNWGLGTERLEGGERVDRRRAEFGWIWTVPHKKGGMWSGADGKAPPIPYECTSDDRTHATLLSSRRSLAQIMQYSNLTGTIPLEVALHGHTLNLPHGVTPWGHGDPDLCPEVYGGAGPGLSVRDGGVDVGRSVPVTVTPTYVPKYMGMRGQGYPC